MLYNPNWKPEVKADPLTWESLVAWLEKQKPSKRYNYWNCKGKCLYGQYMASFGIKWDESGASESCKTPRGEFCSLVYERVASEEPYTFGGALERARKFLPAGTAHTA